MMGVFGLDPFILEGNLYISIDTSEGIWARSLLMIGDRLSPGVDVATVRHGRCVACTLRVGSQIHKQRGLPKEETRTLTKLRLSSQAPTAYLILSCLRSLIVVTSPSMPFPTDNSWPAGLLRIFEIRHDKNKPLENRCYGPYDKLNHCFGDFHFLRCVAEPSGRQCHVGCTRLHSLFGRIRCSPYDQKARNAGLRS